MPAPISKCKGTPDANGNPSNELSMDTEEYCVAYNSNPGGRSDAEKVDLERLYTCRSNTPLTTFRTRHNWIRNDTIPLDANAKAVWQIGNDKSLAIKCPPQHLQSSRGIARAPTLSTDLDASLSRIDSLRARATILRADQSTAPIPTRRYLTQLLEVLQNQLSEGSAALRIAQEHEQAGIRLRPGTWRRIHIQMREAQNEQRLVQAQVDEVHTEEEEVRMLEDEMHFLTDTAPHPPSPSSPSARSPFSPTSKNKKNLKASRKKKSKKKKSKKKKSKGKKSKRKKKSKGKRK
jgi:hypothetical protein